MFYWNCTLHLPFSGLAWLIIPQDWALNLPWLPLMFTAWRIFIILNAVPSIVAASILLFLPESPKFLFTNTKEVEAVEVLRRMFTINTGRNIEEYLVRLVQMRPDKGSISDCVRERSEV
jgi:VNT family MFS transporter (synaptic vesicle glycoprotein 2)